MCAVQHANRKHVRKSWRSDNPIILPGWGATRVGPGQYPQYTRAPFGEEAVGSSPHRDHRTPQESQTRAQHKLRDVKVSAKNVKK